MSERREKLEREAFIRFVVPDVVDAQSQVAIGVVAFAYLLVVGPRTSEDAVRDLRAALDRLEAALDVPDRFNRTTSKGWYRRNTRGISWLRSSATEHVAVVRQLADAVARCGHRVTELRTHRVGYVTYQDAVQVVAEPFRDTPTR